MLRAGGGVAVALGGVPSMTQYGEELGDGSQKAQGRNENGSNFRAFVFSC